MTGETIWITASPAPPRNDGGAQAPAAAPNLAVRKLIIYSEGIAF